MIPTVQISLYVCMHACMHVCIYTVVTVCMYMVVIAVLKTVSLPGGHTVATELPSDVF